MIIRVISIGTEILSGRTLNTNLAFMGQQLQQHGYEVDSEVCVPDTPAAIETAVRQALRGADVVISSGGLGPTSDDLTRDAVAQVLEKALRFDATVLAEIREFLARRHVSVPPDALRRQAMVPDKATVLRNRNGTAPGLWCDTGAAALILLPGPPRELEPMFLEAVLPRLRELGPATVITRCLHACGVAESVVADQVEAVLAEFPDVTPAYCAQPAQVELRLAAVPEREAQLEAATARVRQCLGEALLPPDCDGLAAAVGRLLTARGWSLAVAESCTGGSVAAAVTDAAGASAYFHGGFVTYADEWKAEQLGVAPNVLARHGAVSAASARAMLDGLFTRTGVEAGIAVTGIAGPAGASAAKPVGLVFIGTGAGPARTVRRYVFPGNRQRVRQRAVTVALNQLRLELLQADARGDQQAPSPAGKE